MDGSNWGRPLGFETERARRRAALAVAVWMVVAGLAGAAVTAVALGLALPPSALAAM